MNNDCLKLTTYFGERHRTEDQFVADALLDLYGRKEVEVSVMLRGAEGFGLKHRLRTDRILTLSEDLPLVSVAVDTRTRIENLLEEVISIKRHGLITLERARMLTGEVGASRCPRSCTRPPSSRSTSDARSRSRALRPSSPCATCSTAGALPVRRRCSAWTAPPTACASGPASSGATPRCR